MDKYNKKKILHVVNIAFVLPYFLGDQIDYLKSKGYISSIVATDSRDLSAFGEKYDIEVKPIPVLREFNILQDLKSTLSLYRYIKKEKFDYVIGHTPKGGLLAMLAAVFAGIKNRVYYRHGLMYQTSTGIKRVILKNIERITAMLANKVVCVSPSVLSASKADELGKNEKNVVIHKGTCNGVDVERFKSDRRSRLEKRKEWQIHEDEIVIGYVGRLVKDKGIVELLDAWKIFLQQGGGGRLLLVGPFEDRDGISEDLRNFILDEKSIIFTDLVEDTVPYYNIMDIFILPSYREGFPTVILEASSMEIPILTTMKTGCVDAIVDQKSGEFIEINADSIARKLLKLSQDKLLCLEYGKFGREWVSQNFRQEVVWQHTVDIVFNKK